MPPRDDAAPRADARHVHDVAMMLLPLRAAREICESICRARHACRRRHADFIFTLACRFALRLSRRAKERVEVIMMMMGFIFATPARAFTRAARARATRRALPPPLCHASPRALRCQNICFSPFMARRFACFCVTVDDIEDKARGKRRLFYFSADADARCARSA